MNKVFPKFSKLCILFNLKSSSSIPNKNFFLEVADYALKSKEGKVQKDHLHELVKDNIKNQVLLKSLHNDGSGLSIKNDTGLVNKDCEINIKSEIECEDEIQTCNPLDIGTLREKISEINLDELKNAPTKLLNLSPIIDKNTTLKNFLKLGVDLHQVQNKQGGSNILIRLDWEKDVKPIISFLKEQADFTDQDLSIIFSGYPRIFRKSLVEIQHMIDHLKARDIMPEHIKSIFTRQPFLFHFDKGYIEKKLIDLEILIKLQVSEMNLIIITEPRVLTEHIVKLKSSVFTLTKSMGFTEKEMKKIVMTCPEILLKRKEDMTENFLFLHRSLNMSYEDVANCAVALASKSPALCERVKYLISIKRFQTDPTQPLYTPIVNIIKGSEQEFCENVAHTSVGNFRKFLKTL